MAIPTKTVKMWELIHAELESQKIPQEKAVPQLRLGLIALYDTNSRAQTGLYKLRVAAEYWKVISTALTPNCAVAGWPDGVPETDVLHIDCKANTAKIMEQIREQMGINSTPTLLGIPRGMRSFRVALTEPLRSKLDKNGGLDLGQLGKFIPQAVSDRMSMEVMQIYGCTGEGSAKLDLAKAFAQYQGVQGVSSAAATAAAAAMPSAVGEGQDEANAEQAWDPVLGNFLEARQPVPREASLVGTFRSLVQRNACFGPSLARAPLGHPSHGWEVPRAGRDWRYGIMKPPLALG